jgi:hypothetical protein
LRPYDDFARDGAERLGKADELDGVAKATITPDQHPLASEIFAAPDTLKMARPGVLGRAGSPGTYSEAGPKFQGWRPRLPPKER